MNADCRFLLFDFSNRRIVAIVPFKNQQHGENAMMARRWSEAQLNATAVFHDVDRAELVGVADLLSQFNDEQFNAVLEAFRLYRQSVRGQEADGGNATANGRRIRPRRRAA